MRTDNPLSDFLTNLAAELTVKVMEIVAKYLKRAALGDAEQRAMHQVYRQAFEGMLQATAADLGEDDQGLLAGILKAFVESDSVAQYLVDLAILKEAPPLDELREAFESLGFDPATLEVDFDDLLTALMLALEEAIRDEASRDGTPLVNRLVVRSFSGLLDELRRTRQEILDAILEGRGEEKHGPPYDLSAVIPYLSHLHHESLQSGLLRTLDPRTKDPTFKGQQVTIDQVYTPLDTQNRVYRDADGCIGWSPSEEDMRHEEAFSPLSAMEAANHLKKLVVLGDPGSGKSTFVGVLSLCLSGHLLDLENGWLDRLAEQGWQHDALLPVHVTLRDFAQDMGPKARHGTAQSLLDHLAGRMKRCGCPEAMAEVKKAMAHGAALLILDGLDEVPAEKRKSVREAVTMLMQAFGRCRFLITCRILSYANPEWQIPGTQTVTLAPFDGDKIQHFIRAWYTASAAVDYIDGETAQARTADLAAAVDDPRLREMATNPMLLTVMAIVHSRDGTLPRETARLYHECVQILMLKWKPDEARHLQDVLGLRDETDLYRILWRIAYEAHEKQGDRRGTADIPKEEVMSIAAEEHLEGDWSKAELFCDYVEERAGLLVGRGGGDGEHRVYTFPHRTFQEYLAGCHMADQVDFAELIDAKARAGASWQQVVLLSTGHMYFNKTDRNQPLLAVQLILQDEPECDGDWQAVALAGDILLLIGLSTIEKHKLGRPLLPLARQRLATWLSEGYPEPVERAAAGRTLSVLGDPRHGVGVKDGLPDIDWVPIPGVEGWPMNEIGVYDIAPFRMAKYPITYAQFQAFAEDDFSYPCWWAGLDAPDEHRSTPGDQYFEYDNHPRERVSWWDAMAFCAWLSDRLGHPTLHEWLGEGRDWRGYPGVRLPTE